MTGADSRTRGRLEKLLAGLASHASSRVSGGAVSPSSTRLNIVKAKVLARRGRGADPVSGFRGGPATEQVVAAGKGLVAALQVRAEPVGPVMRGRVTSRNTTELVGLLVHVRT